MTKADVISIYPGKFQVAYFFLRLTAPSDKKWQQSSSSKLQRLLCEFAEKLILWVKNLMKSTSYCKICLTFKCVHCHREESSLKLVVIWLHYPETSGLVRFTRLITHLTSCEINNFCPEKLESSSDSKVS